MSNHTPHDAWVAAGKESTHNEIKSRILEFAFNNKGIRPVQSSGMLAAVQNKTGRPIFVTRGNFGREQFKQAHKEAEAAGIDFDKMYVFADTATYSGRAISFMRLDESLPGDSTAMFTAAQPVGKEKP